MQSTELTTRWEAIAGSPLRSRVLASILRRGAWPRVAPFGKVNGRWDLRGLRIGRQKPGKAAGFSRIGKLHGDVSTIFKRVLIADVDLSYSDLSNLTWSDCTVTNSVFANAILSGSTFERSRFSRVSFENADLSETLLDSLASEGGSVFEDVCFVGANLRRGGYGSPMIRRCNFSYADLTDVDFDGGRFEDSVFSGEVCSVSFRIKSSQSSVECPSWRREQPQVSTNEMLRVDFANANLRSVVFDRVDLRKCELPHDENHIIIRNPYQVLFAVKHQVSQAWQEPMRSVAIRYLDYIFLDPESLYGRKPDLTRADQPINLVHREDLRDLVGTSAGDDLCNLIVRECCRLTSSTESDRR